MALQLEIVSKHRDIVGDDAVRVFSETGGTIGRSLHNDWILPDPDRYISGRHATIDFKGGAYYLADVSTNGVYLNGDNEPLGQGNPRRLFNGDTIRFGDFEMTVKIDEGESIIVPLDEEPPNPVTDHAGSLVDEDPLQTGVQLLAEEAITGDDEFQSALVDESAETGINEQIKPEKKSKSRKSEIAALAAADLVATDLVDSFLDGLGISRSELHPSTDLGEIMQNAGNVLREFVEGTTQLLASRANLKNAFRLDQTTVLPSGNNPIKLSANTKDTIKQLLVGKEGQYLGPRDAVREVCRDLLFHQDAFLDAMNNAFMEFAARFDPDELQEGFDLTLDSNAITKMFNKKKYWPLYCELYPIMTAKGGGRLPQMCAEEFVKAYEHEIGEYRRLGGGEDLKATVVMKDADNMPEDEANSDSVELFVDDELTLDENVFGVPED